MDTEVIAAIVGGIFAVLAAISPVIVKRLQARKKNNKSDAFPLASGLSAVVGIVQKNDTVLLVRRKDRLLNLTWQFPAGVVKPGQDIRDKVESEVLQETGVNCRSRHYLGARVPDTQVLCHYVHCEYLEGEAQNLDASENTQVSWVHASEVSQFITSDIYIEVQHLLEKIALGKDNKEKVVLGIVVHNNKVLLIKKILNENRLGWQFPGGYIEKNETEKNAIKREVLEETGIHCVPIKKIGEREHPATHSLISYWLCNYKTGEIEIGETQILSDIAWVDKSEAIRMLGERLFGPVKNILKRN